MYKYDFNNICLENCPNNTILAIDNVTCNLIEDNEKNTTNNNTTNNNTTNNNSTNNDTTNNNTTNNNTTNNNTTNNNTTNNDTSNNDTFNNNTINNNTSINNTSNNNKDNTNNSNEKKNFIIIISIASGVLILTVIIFFIVRICRKRAINNNNNETLLEHKSRKKNRTKNIHPHRELQNINIIENEKIKIIFNFNQERTEISKLRQTSLKNLIISYIKRKQFKNNKMIFFLFDGKSISYDEAINDDRKLSEFIPKDLKEKEILVNDWTSFISKSSQN